MSAQRSKLLAQVVAHLAVEVVHVAGNAGPGPAYARRCSPPAGWRYLRDGLVINDLPTVESKAPSHFGGVLLASARHAPLAPDKGYNTHDTLSGVHRSLGAL